MKGYMNSYEHLALDYLLLNYMILKDKNQL